MQGADQSVSADGGPVLLAGLNGSWERNRSGIFVPNRARIAIWRWDCRRWLRFARGYPRWDVQRNPRRIVFGFQPEKAFVSSSRVIFCRVVFCWAYRGSISVANAEAQDQVDRTREFSSSDYSE